MSIELIERKGTRHAHYCDRIDPISNTSNTTSCLSILYDINGMGSPNVLGKDIGSLNVTKLVCAGTKTAGTCFSGAFIPPPLTLAQCNAQKAALGITKCSYDPDYWAGAVKSCGGVSNMPTQEQLDALANKLYGVSNCGTSTCNGTLNYTEATKAGLPSIRLVLLVVFC